MDGLVADWKHEGKLNRQILKRLTPRMDMKEASEIRQTAERDDIRCNLPWVEGFRVSHAVDRVMHLCIGHALPLVKLGATSRATECSVALHETRLEEQTNCFATCDGEEWSARATIRLELKFGCCHVRYHGRCHHNPNHLSAAGRRTIWHHNWQRQQPGHGGTPARGSALSEVFLVL